MEDFLLHNKGSKEPGMVLVRDSAHLVEVFDFLGSKNFAFANSPTKFLDLVNVGGHIAMTAEKVDRDPVTYFDMVHGFATGSVDINDIHRSPRYNDTNLVLVFPIEYVQSEFEKGRDWMSLCGLTLQYE